MSAFIPKSLQGPLMTLLKSGILAVLLGVLFFNVPDLSSFIHSSYWRMLIFYMILGLAISFLHQILFQNFAKEDLAQYFIAVIVFRLLVCASYAGIKIYFGIEDVLLWVLNFFALYILFLVFELISVVANLRAN
jgi:hypothetical protein